MEYKFPHHTKNIRNNQLNNFSGDKSKEKWREAKLAKNEGFSAVKECFKNLKKKLKNKHLIEILW